MLYLFKHITNRGTNMTATILSGLHLSQQIKLNIKNKILNYISKGYREPTLNVIKVGNNPASTVYVNNKHKACIEVGIKSIIHELSEDTSEDYLVKLITELNQDSNVDGILVQLPLPTHINTEVVTNTIDPRKDVDGFHPYNIGKLLQANPVIHSCTPYGVMKMLESTGVTLTGLNAVIVGKSNIVGKPMALELLNAGCTVTIVHSKTKDLVSHLKQADIIIVAVGKPKFIQADWIKPNCIVIDVGINKVNGKIVGDVDFDLVKNKASFISPVPNGVGQMTVAMLLQNTLQIYENNID